MSGTDNDPGDENYTKISDPNRTLAILKDLVIVSVKALVIAILIYLLGGFLAGFAHAHDTNYDPATSAGTDKRLNGVHDETNGSVFIACTNDQNVKISNVKINKNGDSSFDISSTNTAPHCKGEVKWVTIGLMY